MNKLQKFFLPVLLALTALLYARSVQFTFTYFDDNLLIQKNEEVLMGDFSLSKFMLSSANMEGKDAFYRPMQNISFWIDAQLGGMEAWTFHLHNLLLFVLLCAVLFLFLKQIGISALYAFGFSLIYAFHPMFVSAVAWIPARGDLQMSLFALLSIMAFLKFFSGHKPLFLGLSVLAFFAALLSKETAVVLPLILGVYTYLTVKKEKHAEARTKFPRNWLLWGGLAYVCVFALWFMLRMISVSSLPIDTDKILLSLQHYPDLFQQAFFPYDSNTFPVFSWSQVIIGLAIMLALVYCWIKRKADPERTQWGILGAIIIVLTILPLLLSQIEMLYHRLLLPFVGLLLVIYALAPRKWLEGKTAFYALLVLALGYGSISFNRLPDYTDYEHFYGKAIQLEEGDMAAYYVGRGTGRQYHKNLVGALEDFDKAITRNPQYDKPYVLRGIIRAEFNDVQGGIEDITKGIELKDQAADVYYNRGSYYTHIGRVAEAMADYNTAIQKDPTFSLAYNNRANLYLNLREWNKALADYDESLKLEPGYATGYINRALAYYQLKNLPAALENLDLAMKYSSDPQEKVLLYFRKAQLLFEIGKYYDALNQVNTYLGYAAEDQVALQLREEIRKKIQD